MSLTSYRAAPPRVTSMFRLRPSSPELLLLPVPRERNGGGLLHPAPRRKSRRSACRQRLCNIVNGSCFTPPAKPGDDLLFHCLGSSTIGAVRFHGRVRDGIGWVTDAMVTKLW